MIHVTRFQAALPTLLLGLFLAGGAVGCDQAADCAAVCERYQTCFDDEYDVDACRSRCNDSSDDDAFRARVNECDACINERDCVETAFSCGAQCAGVIDEG